MTETGFIGDIHGGLDELNSVMRSAMDRATAFVFLGDYVNRGPSSAAVIDYLVALKASGTPCTFLRGHHDQAFLETIIGTGIDRFLRMGGAETIRSYVREPTADVLKQLRAAVPPSHVAFLESLDPMLETDEYIAAHHGEDLVTDFGSVLRTKKFRIFGHTVQRDGVPKLTAQSALIDTGCRSIPNGKLTCLYWPSLEWSQSDSY